VSGVTPARDNNPDQTDVGLLQTVTSDGTGATTWLMDGAATGFEDPNHLLLADGSPSSYGRLWNDLTANGTD
jgi:hypothetical protein